MPVTIKVFGTFRSIVGNGEITLDLRGCTLQELINELATLYGDKVREEVLDEQGNLDYVHIFFVDGRRLHSLSDTIKDGSEVVITNMFGAG